MRKEGWKEIWFKKKKKFPRVQNPKSTMTLTDDANIIVAKSKNSILYTRHVPLTYTIANRANRFSMLRFELGWPTWMTTSSTFINLFFFFSSSSSYQRLIGPNLNFGIPCFVSEGNVRKRKTIFRLLYAMTTT